MKRALVIVLAILSGCGDSSPDAQNSISVEPESASETWEVIKVTDGDTIDVRNMEGLVESVRFIGIDTPEVGKCGFREAGEFLSQLLADGEVVLVAGGTDDRDRYNRILRYVEVKGEDAGLQLLKEGLAIARYDSRDGYVQHLREDIYIQTDIESPNQCPDSAWQR